MTLNDMIKNLRKNCAIAIRDHDNFRICENSSNSKGVIPYLNYEIIEWFPMIDSTYEMGMFCVLINDVVAQNK